ncbi:uncharacterized protein EMH_0086570 [Eimeria mitis]|uniref:Uncharacterized protein n=1 Tax=Eimeria mitis TaxID=44415 RepID=U6JRM1_9EIME|nr:uncharacterized protein EMH_0086570 [Eimeria mitis]CDJ27456.1 hypothetical protein, conserved [Eimeria mitis]
MRIFFFLVLIRYFCIFWHASVFCMRLAFGALCRVVSLVPEFLFTNCLTEPVYLRQDQTQGPLFEEAAHGNGAIWGDRKADRQRDRDAGRKQTAGGLIGAAAVPAFVAADACGGATAVALYVHPGETHAMYWPQQDLLQQLQFLVGRSNTRGWSGPVVASEETAGRTWVAVSPSGSKGAQPGEETVKGTAKEADAEEERGRERENERDRDRDRARAREA